ncbi:BTB/POZ domain-containing protein [Ananas comosus]|uniref:BTB/POZ domain-containing protein n=1 Tax=Ananas comosus TaxID=4615 RepID=A0A199VVJ1_ANACO|nr:BTB/POZ domain-containing protein [Ananas comosus]
MATAAETFEKLGDVSAMLRRGFLPSPRPPLPEALHPLRDDRARGIRRDAASASAAAAAAAAAGGSGGGGARRVRERVAATVAAEGPGDVELSIASADGARASLSAHRRVLEARSRFFAARLAGVRGAAVELEECADPEAFLGVVGMMYSADARKWLAGEPVERVLALLKVSIDLMVDSGIASCLDYLDSVPWSEDEEEQVVSLLSHLPHHIPAIEVLHRISKEPSASFTSDDILMRVLAAVLQSKDEKARREMKSLLSRLLTEDKKPHTNCEKFELLGEALYHLCHKCLDSLLLVLSEAVSLDKAGQEKGPLMEKIAREADNLQWLVEILISNRIAGEFVSHWADQKELAKLHSKIPCMYRHEISSITAQICIAIGKGHILVSKDVRISLLKTWLEALYEDFGWMRRASRSFDKKMVEDGLCHTILTLPMAQQQEILLRWFDCFLNKKDDCPNMRRAFEVWWRRAFVRPYVGNKDQSHLQIVVCDDPL